MKESISYTFILNIVIVFIFTCFAVVMGTLSYYKAFRANSIIAETIEKYEGFNCVSREEIARKLNNVGYKTPFSVDCNGKGDACIADNDFGYVVTSYNLDMPNEKIVYDDENYTYNYTDEEYTPMNSSYKCNGNGCTTNKHYQYGIYTYMYVEMPVISQLLRLSFFSKTNTMYEFRNFYVEQKTETIGSNTFTNIYFADIEQSFSNLYSKENIKDEQLGKVTYVKDTTKGTCVIKINNETNWEQECDYNVSAVDQLGSTLLKYYNEMMTGANIEAYGYLSYHITGKTNSHRANAVINNSQFVKNGKWIIDATSATDVFAEGTKRHKCGYIRDYSAF